MKSGIKPLRLAFYINGSRIHGSEGGCFMYFRELTSLIQKAILGAERRDFYGKRENLMVAVCDVL